MTPQQHLKHCMNHPSTIVLCNIESTVRPLLGGI